LRFVDGKAELDTNNSSLLGEFPGMDVDEILKTLGSEGCAVMTSAVDEVTADQSPVTSEPVTSDETEPASEPEDPEGE
jgi:hypothetical protein